MFEVNEWYCVEDVNDGGTLSIPPFKYMKTCGWAHIFPLMISCCYFVLSFGLSLLCNQTMPWGGRRLQGLKIIYIIIRVCT